MTYDLAIGDRSYSSWSLRAWLLFDHGNIPVKVHSGRLYTPDFQRLLDGFPMARTVPALRFRPGGPDAPEVVIGETLAIAEVLAENNPQARLWPADPSDRARARWLASEMHAGFQALRNACPMTLLDAYEGFEPDEAVRDDLARIEALWDMARSHRKAEGPWLFGAWSIADAFFAPVAARIAAYALPVGPEAAAYVSLTLVDPSFRRWRAMGQAQNYRQDHYAHSLPQKPWPGPELLAAAVSDGPSVNSDCPYSGRPVTDFLMLGGRIWGFCNPFCRDKTVHDPEAWPAFMAMVRAVG